MTGVDWLSMRVVSSHGIIFCPILLVGPDGIIIKMERGDVVTHQFIITQAHYTDHYAGYDKTRRMCKTGRRFSGFIMKVIGRMAACKLCRPGYDRLHDDGSMPLNAVKRFQPKRRCILEFDSW